MGDPKLDNGFIDVTDTIQSQESKLPDGFIDVTNEVATLPSKKGRTISEEFVKGAKAGWLNANQAVGQIVQYVGKETGVKIIEDVGQDANEYWGKKVEEQTADVSDIRNIESWHDFGKWAAWNIGQTGSQLATIAPFMFMGGGEVEMAKGGFTVLGNLLKAKPGAATQFAKFIGQWAKLKPIDIPVGILEGGQVLGGQLEAQKKGEIEELHPIRGLVSAFIATKLEELGDVTAIDKMVHGIGGQSGNLIARIAKGTAGTGAGESMEEFFQQYAEQFGINPKDINSKEQFMQAVNGAAAGFVGGAAMGSVTGLPSRKGKTEPQMPEVKTDQTGQAIVPTVDIEEFKTNLKEGKLTKEEALIQRKKILKTNPEIEDDVNNILIETEENNQFKEAQNATEKGLSSISKIVKGDIDLPFSSNTTSKVDKTVAIGAKGDKVAGSKVSPIPVFMVDNETGDIIDSTTLATQTTDSVEGFNKSLNDVVLDSSRDHIKLAGTSSATKPFFSTLEIGPAGNDLAAELARIPLNAREGAIILIPARLISSKFSSTSFAFIYRGGKLIGTPTRTSFDVSSPVILAKEFITADRADIHNILTSTPLKNGVFNTIKQTNSQDLIGKETKKNESIIQGQKQARDQSEYQGTGGVGETAETGSISGQGGESEKEVIDNTQKIENLNKQLSKVKGEGKAAVARRKKIQERIDALSPVEPAATSQGKQPWEMTVNEYAPTMPAKLADVIEKESEYAPKEYIGEFDDLRGEYRKYGLILSKKGNEYKLSNGVSATPRALTLYSKDRIARVADNLKSYAGYIRNESDAIDAGQRKYNHKDIVRQAIAEGKITEHPDYPELKKVELAPNAETKPTQPEDTEEVKKAIKGQLIEYKAELINRLASLTKEKNAAKSTRETGRIERLISATETELDRYLREKTLPQDRIDNIRLANAAPDIVVKAEPNPYETGTHSGRPVVFKKEQDKKQIYAMRAGDIVDGRKVRSEIPNEEAASTETITERETRRKAETEKERVKEPWKMTRDEYEAELTKYEKLADNQEMQDGEGVPASQDAIDAYNRGDWETFSRARGYSEEAISNFRRWVQLAFVDNFNYNDVTPENIHRQHVQQALFDGKLTPEEYNTLHASTYGPLEKFAPDLQTPKSTAPKEHPGIVPKKEEGKATSGNLQSFTENLNPLQRGKVVKLLSIKRNHNKYGIVSSQEMIEKMFQEGRTAIVKESIDQKKLEDAREERRRIYNSGNQNIQAKRVSELDTIIANPPTKQSYRFVAPDDSFYEMTKTEYDYAKHLENKTTKKEQVIPKPFPETKIIPATKIAEKNVTTPKEQKEYVLNKLDDLIVKARQRWREINEAPDKITDAEIDGKVAKGIFTRGESPEGELTVIIEVPNDGQYKIPNTLKNLLLFKKNFKSMSISTTQPDIKPTMPSKKPTGKLLADIQKEAWEDYRNLYRYYKEEGRTEEAAEMKQTMKEEYPELYEEVENEEKADKKALAEQYKYYSDTTEEEAGANMWRKIVADVKNKKITLKSLSDKFNGKTPSSNDVFQKSTLVYNQLDFKKEQAESTKEVIKTKYPELYREMFGASKDVSFQRGGTTGLRQTKVQSVVDLALEFIPHAPKVNVVQSNQDCPESVQGIMEEYEIDDAMGFTHNGEVYLISDNLRSTDEIFRTLAHELTHSGLGKFFQRQTQGKIMPVRMKYEALMDAIYRAHSEEVKQLVKTTHTHLNIGTVQGRRQACEEWLCNQTYESQPKWYDKLVAVFHDLLRAVGLDVKLSDAEVRVVLQDAFKEFGGEGVNFKIVHHGTPHVWRPEPGFPHGRPRLDKIGTGEGAAAYGYGWYSAESFGVATNYVNKQPGSLYKLEIPDDVLPKLLDWEKPLSEQSEYVKKALASAIQNTEYGVGKLGAKMVRDYARRKYDTMANSGNADGHGLYSKLEGWIAQNKTGEIQTASKWTSKYLASIGIPGNKYLDQMSRNKPLADIKKAFLDVIPENADFNEVMELIGTSAFTPEQESVLRAINDNDWLGFDYPSQAISAALGKNLSNYEVSPELLNAISDLKNANESTYNYVIWDQKVLDRIALLERNGEKLDAIREEQEKEVPANFQRAPVRRSQPMFSRSDNPDYKWWEGMDIKKQIESLPFTYWQKPRDFIAEGYVPITRSEADELYYAGLDKFVAHVNIKGDVDTTGNEGLFMRPLSFYGYQYWRYDESHGQETKAKKRYSEYRERYLQGNRGEIARQEGRETVPVSEEAPEMERAALREFIQYRAGLKEADKVKMLERSLIGKNVGFDFFPTPKATAEDMVERANISEGMDVLEPSAGNGNIAEAIRDAGVKPDVAELSSNLREVLEAKEFNVVSQDFLDMNKEGKLYDRIIMNPPFSNSQDIEHVRHAYDLLKPNGRIVAIMGEGAFFRGDKKATEFREWLDNVGGYEEKLPQGTFTDKSLMASTGVNARMVVIDKGVERYSIRDAVRSGASFSEQLDDFAAGKLINRREPITIGETPHVLEVLGAEQLPLVVTQGTIEKATAGKHGISFETLKQLPEQLADPVMVFDSATEADSLVVMTELKQDGKTIVAAVQLSKGMGNNIVNDIVSVHPRSNEYHFINWINQGLLRYMNKSKSRAWSLTSGLQLPRVSGSKLGFKNKILFDYDLVKGKYATVEEDEKYHVSNEQTMPSVSIDTVRDVFKGQDVSQTTNGEFVIKIKNGSYLIIKSVKKINVNDVAFELNYGEKYDATKQEAVGMYKNGVIKLHDIFGTKAVLYHESIHFMEDLNIIRPLDVAALRGHIKRLVREGKFETSNKEDIGGAEDRANFIADALNRPPKGLVGRIINRINEFIDKLINLVHRTAQGVVRDIRTGEIYNEKPRVRGSFRDIYDEAGTETGRYAIGQRLRESDIPVDDVAPIELNVKGTNKDILTRAAEEYRSWPEKVTAADGSEILLANPEEGYISKRALHLIWDNEKDRIHIEKAKWLPNVPETLKNAAVRLVDQQSDNRIYVRSYNNNVRHMVVVAPDGHVIEQESFKGKLVTQFPYAEQSRQDSMIIDWERKGEGRSQGNPNPTPPASTIPGSQQGTFQNKNTLSDGKVKEKYSIRKMEDPPVSNDPKVLNKYLREETLSIAQKIQDELFAAGRKVQKELQPKNMTMRELILKSPEFFDHPEMKRIVGLFAFDKDEIKHEMFNDFNAADKMGPEETVTEAAQALKRKGLSLFDRLSGKESEEYKQLDKLIDIGDTEWVHKATNKPLAERQKLFKEWAAKNGYTEDTIKVWQLYMDSGEKALNVQTAQLRGMIADIIEEAYFKGETPDLNELKQTLKGALAEMEQWKGFYAPRIRERGDWMVQAFKKHGPLEVNKEFYRNHRTSELAAQRLARSLEKEGWTIYSPELTKLEQKKSRGEKVTPEELYNARVGQVEKLPEGVYQDQNSVATAKLIDAAIDKMKSDDTSEFKTEVLRAVADEIKARGARAHMIHRKEGFVIRGFIEDPIERHLIYWSQIAGGASKARVAKQAYQILLGQEGNPGIDPIKEKLEYETATDYIRNQLRNADAYDRMIGLAKSIATFKFLGFNLRSLAVNTTAVGTTAPGAVHQYALDGKGSMFRVMNELARSGKDYGHLMTAKFFKTGWKLSNADEQKFIDECHKKGYDDAQYVREAKGTMGKIHSRVWSTMMDWSMYAFGVSERWNRGTTMLAAYRLARKNGATHEDAAARAKTSSDKAHGVYGKAADPMIIQGTNPAARVGQMAYVYQKFGHTYLQNLYELGFKKRNIKAFVFTILSPLVLAGGAAMPFKDAIFSFFGVILRSIFGEDKDPEKWVWDVIREHLGDAGERIGRHGLTGAAGIDISGSLSIGVGIPKNFIDLTGAIGGVATDISEFAQNLGRGQYMKASENILPAGAANLVRAARESGEGVTTRNNRRVWNEEGKPYTPDTGATVGRAFGFRSANQAVLSERTWEGHREQAHFADKRSAIYEEYRAWIIGGRDEKERARIFKEMKEYNESIKGVAGVPRITSDSLRTQARNLRRPSKNERAILRD